jgi:pyrroline-5-carboxylate reductase
MKVGIIGCGNLGIALAKGIRSKHPQLPLILSKRNTQAIEYLKDEFTEVTSDNPYLISSCDVIILALKPYTILDFVEKFKDQFDAKKHTIISVATGVQIAELAEKLGSKELSLFRAMPNTAAGVGESITALSFTNDPLNKEKEVSELFSCIGQTILIDEQLMESATILGACGIAYVLRFMRAMIQGGIQVGFDAKTASLIVSQTVKGAATLLIENGSHPEEEIDKVTTPKGCTIVGLNEMEHSGFSSALIKGIVTSFEKIERHE